MQSTVALLYGSKLILFSIFAYLRIHKVEVSKRVPFDSSTQLWLDPGLLINLVCDR
jgi:hypothetical protein